MFLLLKRSAARLDVVVGLLVGFRHGIPEQVSRARALPACVSDRTQSPASVFVCEILENHSFLFSFPTSLLIYMLLYLSSLCTCLFYSCPCSALPSTLVYASSLLALPHRVSGLVLHRLSQHCSVIVIWATLPFVWCLVSYRAYRVFRPVSNVPGHSPEGSREACAGQITAPGE